MKRRPLPSSGATRKIVALSPSATSSVATSGNGSTAFAARGCPQGLGRVRSKAREFARPFPFLARIGAVGGGQVTRSANHEIAGFSALRLGRGCIGLRTMGGFLTGLLCRARFVRLRPFFAAFPPDGAVSSSRTEPFQRKGAMFVGHYGVSYAVKPLEARMPLWIWFVAVQWRDVMWSLLGVPGH
jgi:hypothetical protein